MGKLKCIEGVKEAIREIKETILVKIHVFEDFIF